MLGFARRKVAEEIGPRSVPEEVILREAYHIGRHSASNVACPPAPGGIPVWVENNVESFSILVDRLSREYRIPDALSSRVYRRFTTASATLSDPRRMKAVPLSACAGTRFLSMAGRSSSLLRKGGRSGSTLPA